MSASESAIAGAMPLWPRRYTVVGLCFLAVFVCYIDRVNISVAALAMQEEFGWSETTKGYVLSSFFIGYMLFMVPSGWIANRVGGKIVLGLAVLWWSLFTIITPVAALVSLPLLIVARIAMGCGEAAMFPAAYNIYGRWVLPAERSRAVSLLVSGIPLGTLFALTTTGWIIARYGWPAVFYVFGATGFVWTAIWFFQVRDRPADDPKVSPAELALLQQQTTEHDEKPPVPWRRLLSSPAVWALLINHFCSNWVLYMLLAWLPSYFRGQLGLSIANAGLYSAAPWLTMFVVGILAGWFADGMVKRGISLTAVRKIMQTIGLIGSAIFMLLARDVDSATTAMLLMCGALGAASFTWSGFVPNHLDIAPRYADVLMGITNTAGTVPGIIGVALTGWLVDTTGTYSAAFTLVAVINVFGALVWLAFATGERVID
ncbi:MAG: ACS family MFS transporter [Gammaproteobacteria bacterium]|jgi:ACS family sodium-dependent inorganic phosphate cotransporter